MSYSMVKRTLFIALAAMTTICSFAKDNNKSVRVVSVSQDVDAANAGVIYALPKTIIRVRVDAELTIEKVGPYYKYSNKYLNISDVVTQDSKSWKIVSASVETSHAIDYTKRYKIFSDNGSLLPNVNLSADGVLTGINNDTQKNCCAQGQEQVIIPNVDFYDVPLDQQVLTKTSTAAMAEQVAQSIYNIRAKRLAILGGEESTLLPDAGSYDKVLAELDRLEKQHVELFVGKRVVVKVTKYFDLEPSTDAEVIARFTEKDGFLSAMDLTGKPIYVEFATDNASRVNAYPEGSKQRKSAPLFGLRYCIPAVTLVKVLDRNNVLTEAKVLTSQGGQVATLPVSYLNNDDIQIQFDINTGALLNVSTIKTNK